MNRLHLSWLFGLLVATSTGCDRTVPVGSMDGTSCSDVGATKSPDNGCNTCTCGADHKWACTARDCQCSQGETKLDDVGCATCYCTDQGTWECGKRACLGTGGTTGSGGTTSVGGDSTMGGSAGTPTVCCEAMPVCNEGDTQLSTVGPVPCPPNVSCYSNTLCCSTVWCIRAAAQCEAMPVCDAGDTQIDGICPPDGSCYERSLCGTTINCRKATISACKPGEITAGNCMDCYCAEDSSWQCTTVCSECRPGQIRVAPDGCNMIRCTTDGMWGPSTEMGCPQCTPGQTKIAPDGCNDCTCSDAGAWLCTQESCPACTPGVPVLAIDYCNTCLCNADGTVGTCSVGDCSPAWPGTTRPALDGCNTCVLTTSYTWTCTNMTCPRCTPGATTKATDGCNTCVCATGGIWNCSAKACDSCALGAQRLVNGCVAASCVDNSLGPTWAFPPEMPCPSCTIGTIKPAGDLCNTCACSADGTWACTDRTCPLCTPGAVASDGTAKCNNCTCNAAGAWECMVGAKC